MEIQYIFHPGAQKRTIFPNSETTSHPIRGAKRTTNWKNSALQARLPTKCTRSKAFKRTLAIKSELSALEVTCQDKKEH